MAKLYFNGMLFPELPSTISTNPYAFIRKNTSTGYYDLVLAIEPFYYDESETRLIDGGGAVDLWYRISINSASSATSWGSQVSHSYKGWTIDAARPIFWSNRDIYVEGITSDYDLYFSGSEAFSEDDLTSISGLYSITGETLSEIVNATKILIGKNQPIQISQLGSIIRQKALNQQSINVATTSIMTYSLRVNENG